MSRRAMLALTTAGALSAVGVFAQPQWQDVVRNLRHPNAERRLEAVNRLGGAAYVAAAEPVVPLLLDPDDRVQAAALEAELTFFLTEQFRSTRILSVGGSRSRAQQAFDAGPLVRTAMAAPPSLVDTLITAIRDENARVRFDAVHALGFIAEAPLSPRQIRALADELDHYDPIIRTATARVLGRLRARDAGDRLLVALNDSNGTVRRYAVEAVGLVREDRALFTLRDLLARAGSGDVSDLLLAIARIGAPDDLALLRRRLTDRTAGVRRAAAEGLGRLGDRDSSETLAELLQTDRSAVVRLAAAFALHQLGRTQSHVIASMLALNDERGQARDYLFEIGSAAVPGIRSALEAATDSRHRADLLQAIGYLGSADDVSTVEPFLQDRDARIVRAATEAILRLRRP